LQQRAKPEARVRDSMTAVVRRALFVTVIAFAAVGIAALFVAGARWGGFAPSLEWPADRFHVASGQAIVRNGALVIQQPDARGAVVASLPTASFDSRDYNAIEVDVSGLRDGQPVAVFWRSRLTGDRTFTLSADEAIRGGVRARLAGNSNWVGTITGIGVIVAGSPPTGSAIVGARAVSGSARATAARALREWFDPEGWDNQSINVVFLGGQYQALPFTLYAGVAVLLAIGLWLAWQRKNDARIVVIGLATIAATGWLATDFRWLFDFARVESETVRALAGKSWREKRLAAPDGPLFAFTEQVRRHVEERPGRVFLTSDDAWLRVRGGYHLLPFNVLAIAYHRNLFEPARYRPGDWICFYARSGVDYDPERQLLRWDGGEPLKAERVMADGVGALYRVLP
jgi:hypothetical protein